MTIQTSIYYTATSVFIKFYYDPMFVRYSYLGNDLMFANITKCHNMILILLDSEANDRYCMCYESTEHNHFHSYQIILRK